mmetsp:Transcript_5604/g.7940  ORF Transcript_5604/g.7940 Transcript_5604/m.7940 type:complete len:122 (+) Transcript_5604:599-964(+)
MRMRAASEDVNRLTRLESCKRSAAGLAISVSIATMSSALVTEGISPLTKAATYKMCPMAAREPITAVGEPKDIICSQKTMGFGSMGQGAMPPIMCNFNKVPPPIQLKSCDSDIGSIKLCIW